MIPKKFARSRKLFHLPSCHDDFHQSYGACYTVTPRHDVFTKATVPSPKLRCLLNCDTFTRATVPVFTKATMTFTKTRVKNPPATVPVKTVIPMTYLSPKEIEKKS